jgi:hypothetical protein
MHWQVTDMVQPFSGSAGASRANRRLSRIATALAQVSPCVAILTALHGSIRSG